MSCRHILINKLIEHRQYKSYLEIGVRNPKDNYDFIKCKNKECVDVDNTYIQPTYHMTSDEFFATIPSDKKYDIIFIDAMHTEEYVDRDLTNALKHINKNGMICLHDVIPIGEWAAQHKNVYSDKTAWNGTVWRTIAKLHKTGLNFFTVNNNDCGLTVIYNIDNTKKPNFTKLLCPFQYKDLYIDGEGYTLTTEGKQKSYRLTSKGVEVLHIVEDDDFDNFLKTI